MRRDISGNSEGTSCSPMRQSKDYDEVPVVQMLQVVPVFCIRGLC